MVRASLGQIGWPVGLRKRDRGAEYAGFPALPFFTVA